MIDSNSIKKDFPIFDHEGGLIYLDNSGTSQTPKIVLDATLKYYTEYRANIHRGQYPLSQKATVEYEAAREKVAQFIGADTREIIFTSGATASSNMAIYAMENSGFFSEGDEIVTTIMEHHSVLVPMQELAKRKKLVLKIIPMTSEKELDYAEAEKIITNKTKLVAFVGVSNVTGTINDMKRICDIAKSRGAISMIDATQAAGHIPFNVKDIGCDLLFFSGHKMCGPTGIGILYGKKELLNRLAPGAYGGGMVESVSKEEAHYALVPVRFEAGTPDIAGAIGLGAACDYLTNIGMDSAEKHLHSLASYAISELSKTEGVKLFCQEDSEKNVGVVSFLVEGIHPHDTGEILSRSGVAVRAGLHCAEPLVKSMGAFAVVRASFYIYNDTHDIDELVKGIKEAQKIFKI